MKKKGTTMNTNQTIFTKALKEINERTQNNLKFYCDDNCYWLIDSDEIILELPQDFVDESGMNPITWFIDALYKSEKGNSKNKATVIKSKLTKQYKKILGEDNEELILELVGNAKQLQHELEALTNDIEWTRKVGYFLYQVKNSIEELEYDYFIELVEVA
ncbi:hypothetical protein KPL39_02045 [Clostridium gasigenes]|uniref:hypothetical protein n=1 Tax=Clostridium gasigenes TaxID=94869 RepID=UPI001C0D3040|nr:hypothetical protein [Clostridium gasigenes]MBU3135042.1 hypothetical protein [Clostridium gasigenes]